MTKDIKVLEYWLNKSITIALTKQEIQWLIDRCKKLELTLQTIVELDCKAASIIAKKSLQDT